MKLCLNDDDLASTTVPERCMNAAKACGGCFPRTTKVGRLPGGHGVVGSNMVCIKYVKIYMNGYDFSSRMKTTLWTGSTQVLEA